MNCTSLESLTLSHSGQIVSTEDTIMPSTALNSIRIILCSNKRLKKLELHDDSLFSEDFSTSMSSKLEEFNFVALGCKSQQNRQNLNLFLLSQRDTIKILEIKCWAGSVVKDTVLMLPHLKKLTVGVSFVSSTAHSSEVFPQNLTVKTLTLSDSVNVIQLYYRLKFTLPAFRELESLEIPFISNGIPDLIAETCKTLKKLLLDFTMSHQ